MTGVKERDADAEGLTAEIAALRERLHLAMDDKSIDLREVAQGANALTRMVATQHRLSPRAAHDFAEKLHAALDGLGDLLLPPDR